MAMMIMKFHKLIQSKLLWSIFSAVIIVSFVGWGVPNAAQKANQRRVYNAATIDGVNITHNQLSNARLFLRFQGAADDETLDRNAFLRIATLQFADKNGLKTSAEEVARMIQAQTQGDPMMEAQMVRMFQDKGFNSQGQIFEFFRDEILLQKTYALLAQSSLVAPGELQSTFRDVADSFILQYTILSTNMVADQVKVSEEDLQAFYDEQAADFTLPPQVRVSYLTYKIDDFIETNTVELARAEAFYEDNINRYTRIETNQVEEATLDTNVTAEAMIDTNATEEATADSEVESPSPIVITPFEEVRDDILLELARETAARTAEDRALESSILSRPRRGTPGKPFSELAAKHNLEIKETDFFSPSEPWAEVDNPGAFTRAAFTLSLEDERDRVSSPVVSSDSVYVIRLEEARPERIPELEEVREKVMTATRAKLLSEKLDEVAAEQQKALSDLVASGSTFEDASVSLGLNPTNTPSFSLAEGGLEGNPYGRILGSCSNEYNPGEVTKVLEAGNERIIARISSRKAAAPAKLEEYKLPIINELSRRRIQLSVQAWQENLLADGRFEDLRDPVEEDEGEETADSEAPAQE